MNNAEKVMMNLEGQFWTREQEMLKALEELGYEAIEIDYEYIVITDTYDDDEPMYQLNIGHANGTVWVQSVDAE